MRVETEEKYYCMEPERLIKIAEHVGFKKVKEENEIDEYFTDIDSHFIKNRTCLRIRKNGQQKMEITYKGKSDSLLGQYCKLENNISVDLDNYDHFIKLFSSLGYYSYVEVVKKRIIYSLNKENYKYSIMIDSLPEIGGFVEFEILADEGIATKKKIKKELVDFVSKFHELKLQEVTEPYRDIVAKHLCQKVVDKGEILNICINLDAHLLFYEKDFYKKYKNEISKYVGAPVTWTEYKKNSKVAEKVIPLIDDYLENLIFNGNDLLVTIALLKWVPYKKYFLTKANKVFVHHFFCKLSIEKNKILYMKNDEKISSALKENNVDVEQTILINQSDSKTTNSILLVIINELFS